VPVDVRGLRERASERPAVHVAVKSKTLALKTQIHSFSRAIVQEGLHRDLLITNCRQAKVSGLRRMPSDDLHNEFVSARSALSPASNGLGAHTAATARVTNSRVSHHAYTTRLGPSTTGN